MIAWWIAQIALLGSLLALAAYGAEAALKVARRPTRWVWLGALLMTVALAAMAPTRRSTSASAGRVWQATQTQAAATVSVAPNDAMTMLRTAVSDASALLDAQVQRAWSAWHSVMPDGVELWLLFAWAVTSLGLLAAFVAVHVRYQQRRAHWPLRDVLGTRVRVADDTGPAVIGVTSAEIVVPQWLLTRDAHAQRLVLEHELEHVRQHDPLLLAASQAAVILLPWHPAVWWMASRLRLAIELDCDWRVLQRGASARDYGTLLIDLTDHRTGFGAALPAFSCSPTHLERRLVAMTPKRLKYPLVRVLATGAFASLALLAACEAKLPTAEEMDNMTASTATAAAGKVALIDTAKVVYFINGTEVTKADADKLNAETIASVNVLQKGKQSGGEVRIVTRTNTRPGDSIAETRIEFVRTDSAATSTFVTPGDSMTFTANAVVKRADESKPRTPGTGVVLADGWPMRIAGPSSPAAGPARTGFTGLMILDGVITDPAIVNSLAPDQIASVDIIKGAAATALYSDPRAANGVIRIKTKKGQL
jgi:beta-lactamase regulating signal transducer with metallopeptidase domain